MQGISYTIKTVAILSCLTVSGVTNVFANSFSRAWVTVERTGKISQSIKRTWKDSPLYPELIAKSTEKRLGSISAQNLEKANTAISGQCRHRQPPLEEIISIRPGELA